MLEFADWRELLEDFCPMVEFALPWSQFGAEVEYGVESEEY
jgi:hypothetical protein